MNIILNLNTSVTMCFSDKEEEEKYVAFISDEQEKQNK